MLSATPLFYFSLFNFHFSICNGSSATPFFTFQFSLFNFHFSICIGSPVPPFQFSICIAPSANTLFYFFCGFYELILLLFHHSYAAFVKGFLLIFSMVEKSVLLGLMRFIPSLYSSNNSLPTNFSASTSNVSI